MAAAEVPNLLIRWEISHFPNFLFGHPAAPSSRLTHMLRTRHACAVKVDTVSRLRMPSGGRSHNQGSCQLIQHLCDTQRHAIMRYKLTFCFCSSLPCESQAATCLTSTNSLTCELVTCTEVTSSVTCFTALSFFTHYDVVINPSHCSQL